MRRLRPCLASIAVLVVWSAAAQASPQSSEPPQMRGDTAATGNGFVTTPIVTVGERTPGGTDVNLATLGYRLPGILDGLGAFALDAGTVRLIVNHELGVGSGYDYMLGNGTLLDGSRISYVDLDRSTRQAFAGELALQSIRDRAGNVVTSAAQLDYAGLERFCSGTLRGPDTFGPGRGFADRVYLAGEETDSAFGGPGGSLWALDVATGTLWGIPDVGRGAWENAALLDTGRTDQIALLLGDDHGASTSTLNTNPPPPLYLYVGPKNAAGTFPERNGLAGGALFVWKADSGETTPATFNGTGSSRVGRWVALTSNFDLANAGMNSDGNPNTGITSQGGIDYTADGYAVDSTLRLEAKALGAFQFSRPEDVTTDPDDGSRAVFASTGRSSLFGGADRWGTVYLVDIDFVFQGTTFDPAASQTTLTILHDGDAAPNPQLTLRNPDNVEWSSAGLFVQEDDTSGFSGLEASVFELPLGGPPERILEMDRSAVPFGQTDAAPNDVGNWESSGVIDVTALFDTAPGETLLLLTVQAHSLVNGGVGGSADLVQGGQLLFASRPGEPGQALCFGNGCPCGNDDPTAGCVNSTGAGALLGATGSASVALDDLVLLATNCPPNNSGLFFAGDTVFPTPVFVGDGLGCTGGSSFRYFPGAVDASGNFTRTTPVASAPAGYIQPGVTRTFQAWTRDVLCGPPPSPCPSPCGNNNNLTNAYQVTFVP